MKLNGMRYYKFFMFIMNIGNIAAGVVAIAWCFLYITEGKSKPERQSTLISRGVLAFFITLALFMIVTSVLGCIGALKQHIRTIYVEISFFIFLISVEVTVGVGASVINAWVGDSDDLRLHFYKNTTLDENVARDQTWDRLQAEMRCCGVDGPQDYAIIHRDIPASCCPKAYALREGGAKRKLHTACLNESSHFVRGCEGAIKSRKHKNAMVTAMLCCLMMINQVSIVTTSLNMVRRIRTQLRRQIQENLQAHFES